MAESSNAKDVDDICPVVKAGCTRDSPSRKSGSRILSGHKNVPARICDLCDEAYISPETSRLVDRVIDKYRAGRLEVKLWAFYWRLSIDLF